MNRVLAIAFSLLLAGALAWDSAAAPSAAAEQQGRFRTSRQSEVQLALPDEGDQGFTFALFGDRTGGPADGVEILARAVEEVNLVDPDLVMTVGDLVEGYNDTPQWLVQMAEYKAIMNGLNRPWFPVAGNHDVYWRGEGVTPPGEHERNYEKHFGPLWYAFEHKDCWFIVLYADETNPATGLKRFGDADHQRMSPEQLAFLESTLEETRDARHVFVFLHHPRWTGGQYGDTWDPVHELLVAAGNVTAVFAGHIHRMRYDEADGIEYFTLATVGGAQAGDLPEAGYLHNYQLVTVRRDGIATTTYPVDSAQDPRRITEGVSNAARRGARSLGAKVEGLVPLDLSFRGDGLVTVGVTNPTAYPLEVALRPAAGDPRWRIVPELNGATLDAGETVLLDYDVSRPASPLDGAFQLPELILSADLLANGLRIPLPDRTTLLPVQPATIGIDRPSQESVLDLDGKDDYLTVPSELVPVLDAFTVEAWIRLSNLKGRRGVVCKTESSEYGLFASDGIPSFLVFVDDDYRIAEAPMRLLERNRWHHLAGVYDGSEVSLYLDGSQVDAVPAVGQRVHNDLPLIVGGDVDERGDGTSLLVGTIDEVRVSSVARYGVEPFLPRRRFRTDEDTLLLLHMDGELGPWVPDASPRRAHALRRGDVLTRLLSETEASVLGR
ncbi:MAG: LamG-like jellyroll fold domain-containing protein [Planctomycetota bacterium]